VNLPWKSGTIPPPTVAQAGADDESPGVPIGYVVGLCRSDGTLLNLTSADVTDRETADREAQLCVRHNPSRQVVVCRVEPVETP
jgi:hypothetical protein